MVEGEEVKENKRFAVKIEFILTLRFRYKKQPQR